MIFVFSIFVGGSSLFLQSPVHTPLAFAQDGSDAGSDSDSDSDAGSDTGTDTDSSGCGNDMGSAGGGSTGGQGQDGSGGGTTPVTGTPRIGLDIGAVVCNGPGNNIVAVTVHPQQSVTAFRVDIVTDLNNPEGSVVGTKQNIPAGGGTYSVPFSAVSGVTYHAIEYAYRDGVWVYSDVSDAFTGISCAPEVPVTWTPYCTGASDPHGNNWEWWEMSDENPPSYRSLRPGDGICSPSVTWTPYCTGGSDPNGKNWQWWEKTTNTNPIEYRYLRAGDGICSPSVTWTPYCTGADDPNGNSWQWWERSDENPPSYRYLRPGDGVCVAVGAPADLTVSGITPTSAVAGTATTFSATVTNTGAGSTGIGFNNFYQVRTTTTAYTPHNWFTKLFNIAHAAETITDLSYTTMPALAAGGSGTATQVYTFPQAGTYGIRVCADKSNSADAVGVIAEADETNNCGGWTDVNVVGQCNPVCPTGTSCFNGACVTTCPIGYTGTPPTCTVSSSCPAGYTGTPPNCVLQVCTPSAGCTSAANSCGMQNTGTCNTNGSACSVSTPSESLCPVLSLSADPTRVRRDTETKLTWSATGSILSCSLVGQNGFSSTAVTGTNVNSGAIDAQTTFTLSCQTAVGPRSQSVVVNLIPAYIEQ